MRCAAATLLTALLTAVPRAAADDVVARIGDLELTVADYEQRATQLRRTGYRHLESATREAKLELLDGIVVRQLLILEGRRQGLDRDSAIVAEVDKTAERALMTALYETAALDADSVYSAHTDAELRAFFVAQDYDVEVLSRHVVVDTEAQARQVLAAAQAGTPFDQLVAAHTLPNIRRRFGPDGVIGWFRLGEVFEEVREPMRTMPVDSFYPEPVRTAIGWHVLGLLQRRPVTFAASEEFVRRRLRIQKRADVMAAYVEGLRQRYSLQAHADGLTALRAVGAGDDVAGAPDLGLFTWSGGRLTLGDYLEQVRARRAPHPAALDSAALVKAADNLVGRHIMVAEARRLGLDADASVRRKVEEKEAGLMVERLYLAETQKARRHFTDAELRAFYDGNKAMYTRRDGAVTDFETVRGSIHTLLVNQARTAVMDAFLAYLRYRYADRIELFPAVLDSRAFTDGLLPVGAEAGEDGDEGQEF